MTPTLRPYQSAAVDAVMAYWRRGGGHPLVEVPTGGGKSLILASLAQQIARSGARVLVVTHRKELIEQDARAVRSLWPAAPVGIYSASIGQRRIDTITIAGVQSVYRRAKQIGHIDVVIVDEAHLVPPDGETQYGRLLSGLADINPELRRCGLTATPYRLSQGLLTEGADRLFDSIAYRVGVRELIAQGYLSPLVTAQASTTIDTSGVHTTAGDFNAGELELVSDVDSINDTVADDVAREIASGRTSALLFGVSVAHATRLAVALRWRGISCEVVTGETDKATRARVLDDFKARRLTAIASCDVLTTGFDAPVVDVLAIVRPTKSCGLYVQIAGRGMRLADGKQDCRVLDYGGNIARHGPIDDVKIKGKASGKGDAPTKICPSCCAECAARALVCVECDHEFPAPEIAPRKAADKASSAAIIGDGKKAPPKEHAVGDTRVRAHMSQKSGTTLLAVEYYPMGSASSTYIGRDWPVATEWVCLEHDGFARAKAVDWWRKRTGGFEAPDTVAEAIERAGELRPVVAVRTEKDGRYDRVIAVQYAEAREPGSDDDLVIDGDMPTIEPRKPDAIDLLPDDDLPF